LTNETRLAVGALIDDDRLGQASGQAEEALVWLALAEAEATLAAGVGAPDLTILDGEGTPTRAAATLLS